MQQKLFLCFVLVLTFFSCVKKNQEKTLTIYSYNSMGWIQDKIQADFEEKYHCKLVIDTSFEDTGDMLAKLVIEKSSPKADVAIGLTPATLTKAKKEGLLVQYKSPNIDEIADKTMIFDNEFYATPYDYGAIAIIYDPDKISGLTSFADLWKNQKQLIIEDPRTSSTGLDFLLWTVALYGDKWQDCWKDLKNGILTVSSGWNDAFAKFEAGEAPMMVSYGTDPAYSYEYYKSVKYKAFIPEEGGVIQIEGASIIKGTKNKDLAQKFIDYLLTDEFQENIPLNQWMFPVTATSLPESFNYAIKPGKVLPITAEMVAQTDTYVKEWEKIFY